MKNYFYKIFFACILTSTFYGQQINDTEFQTKTLQVFQNLDKNRVPHGILLDFGMEFTNLQAFNGTLADSTYTTSQTISDIYKTLLMCRVRQVTTGFITPEEYATRWFSQRTKGVITLSGLYFKYNRFADNAYPEKLNYSNNQFSDKFVSSVWQDPYEEKQLFVMTPSIAKYKGLDFQVKLPSNLFLSNYPATVQDIQIDFSDGLGYRIISYDQLVNVSYTQANSYIWKYKITLTNGQTLLSHSKVEVEEGLKTRDYNPEGELTAKIATTTVDLTAYPKTTIVATTPYLNYYGSATVYIRYANGGSTITKPLIVAEGFDTGIILNPEQEAGDNNIEDFLINVNNSNSNLPIETNSYDIIYVDWNNGVDFIQRNAYVLEEVIKWVNQNKSGTQQNVVLGQSMGGLVARYALKDMENKGLNHDSRLYVSHDAPQLGANTPLSIQYSTRHLRNMYINTPIPFITGEVVVPLIYNFAEGFSSIINLFGGNTTVDPFVTPLQSFSLADVPAARQMQYNWVNNNYQIYNVIHEAWQQELTNLGYPVGFPSKPIRNIAIANGSECGITQIDNGNIMSYIKDAGRDTFLSNYIGLLDVVYGALITNPLVVGTALFPGKSYWQIDFQSKYMTTLNESKNIYHGSIKYKKKVFWFIPISITITEKDMNQPTDILPYDIYGGGVQRTDNEQLPIANIVSNRFGFIPTASALDIGKGTVLINDTDYRQSYVGALPPVLPKNTPFQNFVTGFVKYNPNQSNSKHISFNTRNGNWLVKELIGTNPETTNCSYVCSDSQITGSENVCMTANYTAPSGATNYTWSISQGNNLVTISGNGTNSIVLNKTSPNASGPVTLNLNYGSENCGYKTITKVIWVGAAPFSITRGVTESETCDTKYHYVPFIINLPPNTYLSFNYLYPNVRYTQSGSTYTFQFLKNYSGPFTIIATATNGCGSYTLDTEDGHFISSCGSVSLKNSNTDASNDTSYYTVYPNPTNDVINVSLLDESHKPVTNSKIIAELYDFTGQPKQKVEIKNNIVSINCNGLTKGIYILKISIDGNVESHQVVVK